MKRLLEAVDAPSRARVWALLLLGAALAAVDLRAGIGPEAEGSMLQWGRRIADGQWPYRDFWCDVLPGQPLLQALVGDSIVGWRVLRVVTGAVAAVLAYLLVRREAGERWAVGAWAACALALAWPLTPGPSASAVALALGALLLVPRSPAGAGALCGLCALFRPEIGLAALVAVAVLARRDARAPEPAVAPDDPAGAGAAAAGRLLPAWRRAPWSAVVAGAGVFLVALAPFLVVAPGELFSQVFGSLGDQGLRRLALPLDPGSAHPFEVIERLFPTLLVAACAIWALIALPRGRTLALVPLILAGLAVLLARADPAHLLPLAALLPVAVALAGGRETRRVLQIALGAVLAVVVLHGLDRIGGHLREGSTMVAVDMPGAQVRTTPSDARALGELAQEIDRLLPPGEPLLVVPPRFDRVRAGNPLLYVLLSRENPTRYDAMRPGVVTTAEVQREIRDAVTRRPPRVVVRWVAADARLMEDNASARSSGVRLLDDWLRDTYRLAVRVGDYELLLRKD